MKTRTVLVGVSGGISAYKTCELVRQFIKSSYQVYVVMTEHAAQFVTPLTFKTLSQNPVFTDMWEENNDPSIAHISLSQNSDIMVVAPATANIIGKISHGIADDLLSTLCLSFKGKIILAPAMNENMYLNPVVQENIKKLKNMRSKYIICDAEKGDLACGIKGWGRMADINTIFNAVKNEIK